MSRWIESSATVREAILQASLFLSAHEVPDARLQAEVLLAYTLGIGKAKLFAELQTPLSRLLPGEEQVRQFEELVQRRAGREPLQYLVKGQEFFGRWFQVQPGVLIPRPETELLVETCLHALREMGVEGGGKAPVQAVDIGTGSGAIAITLGLERPDLELHAVDLSDQALRIAKSNAESLGCAVRFWQGDLLEPIIQAGLQRVQVVVSNPPYIPSADIPQLQPEVSRYEPVLALDGGADGLDPYRKIIGQLPQVLVASRPCLAAFEIGIHQAQPVRELLAATGLFDQIEVFPDLAGIPRVVAGKTLACGKA